MFSFVPVFVTLELSTLKKHYVGWLVPVIGFGAADTTLVLLLRPGYVLRSLILKTLQFPVVCCINFAPMHPH